MARTSNTTLISVPQNSRVHSQPLKSLENVSLWPRLWLHAFAHIRTAKKLIHSPSSSLTKSHLFRMIQISHFTRSTLTLTALLKLEYNLEVSSLTTYRKILLLEIARHHYHIMMKLCLQSFAVTDALELWRSVDNYYAFFSSCVCKSHSIVESNICEFR